jgi:N-acetylmuramic acid 6-phosphate etherase
MDQLQTEARNPASTDLDSLTPLELVRLINAEDARVLPAVAAQAEHIARAIEVIAERLRGGGRLIYAGAGTSGRLGVLDATECPPTFNASPGQVVGVIAGGPEALTRAVEGAEDRPELAEQDLAALGLSAADVVVGIATSGRTPYVGGALKYARRQGAYAIGLFCNDGAELEPLADLAIVPVVGPEVLTGSTRLKAGTATKLVLNLLSTGAMVRLGKTFGNLMVDLRVTNSKLRARTNRIVRTLTGLSAAEADELLRRCGGELKTALTVQLAGVSVEEARARLQAAGGQVRAAVGVDEDRGSRIEDRGSRTERRLLDPRSSILCLGVDGGGTHTVALLASADGAIGGRGEAGPSNLQAVGQEQALRALDEAVGAAFRSAGLARVPGGAACLGLAGAGREEDQRLVREWAARVELAERVEVTTDVALLLAAGTPAGWGLALVAGTGSVAYGRSEDGRTARAGGWGPLLGDEGSGYALALGALRAVTRAADGVGPASLLSERLLEALGLGAAQELIPWLRGAGRDRAQVAALVPLVLEAAARGDAVARELAEAGARDLALAGAAVARRLGMAGGAVPLALAGGVIVGDADHRGRVLEALRAAGLNPTPMTLVPEPARGALRLAASLR